MNPRICKMVVRNLYNQCIVNHQDKVNDTSIESGKWHCFDIPFMLMTHDKETAEKYLAVFQKYDQTKFKECFQIGWEQ